MDAQQLVIRLIQPEELKEAHILISEVFNEHEAHAYTEEGKKAFEEYVEYEYMLRRIKDGNMLFWGAFVAGTLQGVLASAPHNHVSLLFVRPEYQNQGLARGMFTSMLEQLKKEGGYSKITVNAAPTAYETYKKLGFKATDPEYTVSGIRFIPMCYEIEV